MTDDPTQSAFAEESIGTGQDYLGTFGRDGVSWEVPQGKARTTLLEATARINLWHGAVRSTKTVTSLQRWVEFVDREAPDGPLVMAGYSQQSVVRNCVLPLQEHYGNRVTWNRGTGICTILGRPVHVMGAGTITGWRALRGMTCAGIYVDETSLVSEPFWNMALSRMSTAGAKMFATTNPESMTHWLHRKWVRRAGELDMKLFHLTLDDNPFLGVEYKAALRAEYVGVWYRRYILGQWVAAEGAIWPQLDPDVHLVGRLAAAPPTVSRHRLRHGQRSMRSRYWIWHRSRRHGDEALCGAGVAVGFVRTATPVG